MADEAKEMTIEEMTNELSGDPGEELTHAQVEAITDGKQSDQLVIDSNPPASSDNGNPPAAEPEKPAESQEAQSESGPDDKKETQESKGSEEKPKAKFEKKEKGEASEEAQKRFNKLTWERHEAERRADEAARENAELKKKLEAQASGKPASEAEAAPDKPVSGFSEQPPVKPVQDDFETLEEYMDARDKYVLEFQDHNLRKREFETQQRKAQEAAEAQQKEAQSRWSEKVAKFSETNPNISAAISTVGPFLTKAGQADFVMQSEVGLEIVSYLNDHAEEAVALAKSGDTLHVSRALGRIEAQILSSKTTPPKPKTDTSLGSDGLPNPTRVSGGSGTPGGINLNDPNTSIEDFQREFKRQIEAAS